MTEVRVMFSGEMVLVIVGTAAFLDTLLRIWKVHMREGGGHFTLHSSPS